MKKGIIAKKKLRFFSEYICRDAARRNKSCKTNSYSNLKTGYILCPGFIVEMGYFFSKEDRVRTVQNSFTKSVVGKDMLHWLDAES
jgi:hypothetical protein